MSFSRSETQACGPSASGLPVGIKTQNINIRQSDQSSRKKTLQTTDPDDHTCSEIQHAAFMHKRGTMQLDYQYETFTNETKAQIYLSHVCCFLKKLIQRSNLNIKPSPYAKQSQPEPDVKNIRLPGATKRHPVEHYVRTTTRKCL